MYMEKLTSKEFRAFTIVYFATVVYNLSISRVITLIVYFKSIIVRFLLECKNRNTCIIMAD